MRIFLFRCHGRIKSEINDKKEGILEKGGIVLIIVFSSGAVFAEGTKETTPTGYTEGEITYLEGDVTVNGTETHFGSSVGPGEVVKTGADSYCDIVFGKKNIMRVRENTLVEVNIPEGTAELEEGALGAVFRKLSYAVRPFL